jgi:hypothetical protein
MVFGIIIYIPLLLLLPYSPTPAASRPAGGLGDPQDSMGAGVAMGALPARHFTSSNTVKIASVTPWKF